MNPDIPHDELFIELGYSHPAARAAALEVLIAAGLTNARKKSISPAKRDRCRDALAHALVRVCSRCESSRAETAKRRVPCGDPAECEVCSGSPNRSALEEAWRLLRERKMQRVVVVGGGPGVHKILREAWPPDSKLRIVPGDSVHTAAEARANLQWADVVAVWGGTILSHSVSTLYTRSVGPEGDKVFQVSRRGVEALADGLTRHLSRKHFPRRS